MFSLDDLHWTKKWSFSWSISSINVPADLVGFWSLFAQSYSRISVSHIIWRKCFRWCYSFLQFNISKLEKWGIKLINRYVQRDGQTKAYSARYIPKRIESLGYYEQQASFSKVHPQLGLQFSFNIKIFEELFCNTYFLASLIEELL